jgi:hypothetical protein
MSRYSNEQQQDILAKIRETLLQIDPTLADKLHDRVSNDVRIRKVSEFDEPPQEDLVERWRSEANEQEERFGRERAARLRNVQIARASTAAIYEQRIIKLEAQLLRVIRAMCKVTENVEAELRELRQEGAEAEARQADLETKLAEALLQSSQLCETAAADYKSILDLLSLLPTRCERPADHGGQ